MKPWHFRYARVLVYVGVAVAAAGVGVASAIDSPSLGQTLVAARQLFGLWALALLLGSMLLGPLTGVLPWLPWKSSLLYARRAVGVSGLLLALAHVGCYLWSVYLRDWRELYRSGPMWVAGLVIGTLALAGMAALGITSADRAVRRLGGRRWKWLHSGVYLILPLVLLHALLVGADFGINSGPDVHAEADFGAGITFACLTVAWLVLFLLRRKMRKSDIKLSPAVL